MTPDRAAEAALRGEIERRFAPMRPGRAFRIGVEAEWLVRHAGSGDVAAVAETARALRRFGLTRNWREAATATGPRFLLPDGGALSFEPGGQLEFSSPPLESASVLLDALAAVDTLLRAAAAAAGLELLGVGIDPRHPLTSVPLQLTGERYRRMDAYFATIGTAGARMMRQTAALQVNLDTGAVPGLRWRVLNALAPYATAVFANSPVYAGRPTGARSYRAVQWLELDPYRTGTFAGQRPSDEYVRFALRAPFLFERGPDGRYRPFAEWLADGALGPDAWRLHLTTLFPEVRPKDGYLEFRPIDALPAAAYPAALAWTAGMTASTRALAEAADRLGPPDLGLAERAARQGLADPAVAAVARDLVGIALYACRELGPGFMRPEHVAAAEDFFRRCTLSGRDPGGPHPLARSA